MADLTFTVDGKQLTAPKGTLLIEACRNAGITIGIRSLGSEKDNQ